MSEIEGRYYYGTYDTRDEVERLETQPLNPDLYRLVNSLRLMVMRRHTDPEHRRALLRRIVREIVVE